MIVKSSLLQLAKILDGLPVLGCLPGTPAALAGVRYGDVLLSVNGQRTRTLGDYVEAKGLRVDGMSVVVFRSGEECAIAFEYDPSRPPMAILDVLTELVALRPLSAEMKVDGSLS